MSDRSLTHTGWLMLLLGMHTACTVSVEQDDTDDVRTTAGQHGTGPIDFPIVADNVRHDTLLVQVTFDLKDGSYLMVAGNVAETFEGLRLYRYRPLPDSSAQVIHWSAPAYDSWTMLPTCFGAGEGIGAKWVLANFGERQSWGQKVMFYENGFLDRGFMHVALPERVVEPDTTYLKRTNIAPHMRWSTHGDTTLFTFACDSVFLYDDLQGGTDLVVSGGSIRFTHHPVDGLVLWIDGRPHLAQDPA